MTEESILILNMLREGKLTAEQADSLLRAVRETSAPIPPIAPVPPIAPIPPLPPVPDPAAMASMQSKLAELQGKLGELQGKLGAAQAVRTAEHATSLAGKILDHLPRPEMDMGKINKAVDEAMRGLNSLKNDAVRTAKTAARQASHEARRAAREGRKAMKFEFNFDLGSDNTTGDAPINTDNQPEASETTHDVISWSGADRLLVENKYGSMTIIGADTASGTAEATVTKKAWAATDAEARVVLQQVFLTHQVENGRCKIGVAAPQDSRDRVTVDYEIRIPKQIALEAVTTYGVISANGVASALTAKSASGDISLEQPFATDGGETKINSASGNVHIVDWNAPSSSLQAETNSGDIYAGRLTGQSITLTSRSGDVSAKKVQVTDTAVFESASGDVEVLQGSAGSRLTVKTQSGHAAVSGVRSEQIQVETVSGDAEIKDVIGTLTVKTVSGDVESSGADSPAVSLLTVSGDAHWKFAAPFSGAFSGTTVSGDLRLDLPSASDARIEMNTTSGTLELGLPLLETVLTEKHAAGRLGAGTGSVRLQSVSGDLVVSEHA